MVRYVIINPLIRLERLDT